MNATTQNTVTLYRTTCTNAYMTDELGSGYSLIPWMDGSIEYNGYDDDGAAYVLPAGYEVAESGDGCPGIYEIGPAGRACELVTSKHGRPALILPSCDVITLRRAPEDD